MSSVAYIMQWGDHKTNVHNHLRLLFEEQKFVDLTLFCSTHSVKVHSVVIASSSSYFEKVLLRQNGVNSVIVLKDMKFEVLRALIEFMYCGKTTVLDEDVDALLYASKKFEVKGLSRMTRQGVMFSAAEKTEQDVAEPNHRFIFPAESAQPGMIQAVLDLSKNQTDAVSNKAKVDCLRRTVFQQKAKLQKKNRNFGFPETAMSDTEYAILKEAEESRKALEKLQKYVLNPDANSQTQSYSNITEELSEGLKSNECFYSNSKFVREDEIAAKNLSNELNLENKSEILESTILPSDVPIFVDDGNGNYVTLDVEMANMITGQEIKYNLVQGVVMTADRKGSQLSKPASILIPENQTQLRSMPVLSSDETEIDSNSGIRINSYNEKVNDEILSSALNSNIIKRKPFVVKEIIKVKHAKKETENLKIQGKEDEDCDFENLVKFGSTSLRGVTF